MESDAADAANIPRAYAQWVIIIMHNVGSGNVRLKNLQVLWGKLHADGDKDKELSRDQFEGQIIRPDQRLQLNACGRAHSPSGTEGRFDLCDADDGDRVIRHFYWDCPWGSKRNTWTVSGTNSNWIVEYRGQNLNSGALGTIYVELLKRVGKSGE
ncbi:Ostreolysin A6 [Paramarasmius palmivorus]|uniref:Ostreolysin A6 n=1 Tax=Paramarasmius palmivorus TaxID=297713 RepID=A0AAW0D806_9AGAR